jgi:hypothetical protein
MANDVVGGEAVVRARAIALGNPSRPSSCIPQPHENVPGLFVRQNNPSVLFLSAGCMKILWDGYSKRRGLENSHTYGAAV